MIEHLAVVVPARNEEVALTACLAHLRIAVAAVSAARPDLTVRLVVVLDECTDGSRTVLRGVAELDVLEIRARAAGGARAAGADHVLGSTDTDLSRIWLANTDADSLVPADWLVAMITDAEHGAHLVLGTVEPDALLDQRARELWRSRHRLVENHPYVHGANFGIRGDVYRRLGGWAAVATGEDVALAARAALQPDVIVARTARIPVVTSSRPDGRAPGGFAAYLSALADELADTA